jgi:hypothetical protein
MRVNAPQLQGDRQIRTDDRRDVAVIRSAPCAPSASTPTPGVVVSEKSKAASSSRPSSI